MSFGQGYVNGEASGSGSNGQSFIPVLPQPITAISPLAIFTNAIPGIAVPPYPAVGPPAFTNGSVEGFRRTGIVYDVRMMLHASLVYMRDNDENEDLVDWRPENRDHQDAHPEQPARISEIYKALKQAGLVGRMREITAREVTKEEAMLVHSEQLWDDLQSFYYLTVQDIKDTYQQFEHHSLYVNSSTSLASRLSCGGVIAACEAVVEGRDGVRNAFAVVRPPGHHAEPGHSMGFCFLNNVAVAVQAVRRRLGVGKVLILDWDVHHGNGTQRAFYEDPNVLYVSLHRHDGGRFYPCSDFGALDVTGTGAGAGTSVNIPWPGPGPGDAEYLYAFQRIIMPIAYEFAPELVIISAGFDAAKDDNMGGCNVTPAGYAHMTHMLSSLAGGKLVVALEGGYHLPALSASALAVARVLLGEDLPELAPMQCSEIGMEVMYQVAKVQGKYWKSIDVRSCEPLDEGSDEEADLIFRLPELIKKHRAKHMQDQYGMFPLPIAEKELDALFPQQILTDETAYTANTLVLFVHDLGNIQVEHTHALYTDCDVEKSHFIDASNAIVRWAKTQDYALIDVNMMKVFPSIRAHIIGQSMLKQNAPKSYAALMRYIWDNFIELGDSRNIILFGYGSGCKAIMSLVNDRDVDDDERVKAVIQVGGMHSLVRPDPDQDEKRAWFRTRSRLYLPEFHPVLDDERVQRRLHTQIITMKNMKLTEMLKSVLPDIKEYVNSVITAPSDESTLEQGGEEVNGASQGGGPSGSNGGPMDMS